MAGRRRPAGRQPGARKLSSFLEDICKPSNTLQRLTIRSKKDLDQLIKSHPQVAALPSDDAQIRTILKSKPVQLECGPGEVLCLADSGSTISAAHIAKLFPALKDTVKSGRKSRAGDYATPSCGKEL